VKAGAKYEQFVYEKLQRFFPDAVVRLNDKIPGRESKFDREIDVSVRMSVDDIQLLYIVQCKDWASRVDINTLGAFSAVIQDVGAAKGFLLCTSGFYETNYQYALARGIELVTIEDIDSDKWTLEIQIPFVYVRKINNFLVELTFAVNEALVELSRGRELTLDFREVRVRDGGTMSPMALEQYILQRWKQPDVDAKEAVGIDLMHPSLEICLVGAWVGCSRLSVALSTTKIHYLKYVTPTEYSQLRDHVRGTTVPLHARIKIEGLQLDNSFVEMPAGSFAGFPGLWMQVEESNVIPERMDVTSFSLDAED
jgi:hypothetical protein